ncbi:MAG: GNAT family N-acetyltransferase [Candidatus Binatia bacterium]
MSPENDPSWLVEPLNDNHNRAAFSCDNEALDHYLKERASQDARRYVAAPFVLVDKSAPNIILGYYTLSAFGVDAGELPAKISKKLPRYPIIPATLIGGLAVDHRHRGKSIGEALLMDALRRALEQSFHIASVAVIVDAIDEPAARFYERYEFVPFPDKPNRLFLLMKTIAALFGD